MFVRDSWKFVHVSGGGRQPPLSTEESAYMTLKLKDDGELEARDVSFIDVDGWKKN